MSSLDQSKKNNGVRRRALASLALLLGVVAISRFTGCGGSDDALASLDFLLCEEDAECEAGVCSRGSEEVETTPILARAVESREASRFAPDGLFVLATWESGDRYVELEFDVPTDRVGYVDHDFRYAEYVSGEAVFRATETRGRIILVEPVQGELPFAGFIELRMENREGEVRRLHRGFLDPDDENAVALPRPLEDPIDWDHAGIELVRQESTVEEPYQYPEHAETTYDYDYRVGPDPFEELVDAGCSAAVASCSSTSYYEEEDFAGESRYFSEDSGCSYDTSGCESDDDVYYYDESEGSSCSSDGSDSSGSFCQGDSDDDVWDDDSEASGCTCASDTDDDYYYYEDEKASSCTGDDSDDSGSCKGDDDGDYDYSDYDYDDSSFDSSSDCSGCGGDEEYLSFRGDGHRRELRQAARGPRARSPVQRSLSFSPIVLALAMNIVLRRRRQ